MIRATIIFLLAIALGALTVSGQERDGRNGGEAELRRRIRLLTEDLKRRADQAPDVKTAARLLTDLAKRLEDEYPRVPPEGCAKAWRRR